MDIKTELMRIAEVLRSQGVEYAVCGGLAVVIHGYPRTTRDIDLLVREEDLDRIRPALEKVGFTLPAGILSFDAGKETERKVFRISKAEGEDLLTLDLVLVNPLLEDVWSGRVEYRVGDQALQVVSLAGLKKMKTLAGRPQDLADIAQLESGS
jgi:hypothetical protein